MKERAPAFQFYPKDFVSDEHVVTMSMSERGIYISLLCFCWLQGSIPKGREAAARLCNAPQREFDKAWPVVSARFVSDPSDENRLRHKRLDDEREKQRIWSEKSAAGGKRRAENAATNKQPPLKGGLGLVEAKRNTPKGDGDAEAEAKNQNEDGGFLACGFADPEDFEGWFQELLQKHPNRNANGLARGELLQLIQLEQFDRMEFDSGYEAAREAAGDAWTKERGRFAPNLSKFIADRLWKFKPVDGAGIESYRSGVTW